MTLEETFREYIREEVQAALGDMQLRPESNSLLIGKNGTHDTIQAAWDDTRGSRPLVLSETYDPGNENYPIEIDVSDSGFVLTSLGPSTVDIGHSDVDTAVMHIKGDGVGSYARAPTIQGVRFVGGNPGLKMESAPFGRLADVVFYDANGHGFEICDGKNNTYGTQLFACQAWNCSGDGFNLKADAGTHATGFFGCSATANGGAGFRLRGYATGIYGGVSQYNHSWGVRADAPAQTVRDCYIEGNARKEEYPVAVYGKKCHGLTVSDNYFNGQSYSRTRWSDHETSMRGVNVHDSASVTVRDNVVRNYGDVFVKGFDSEIDASGNFMLDDTSEQ